MEQDKSYDRAMNMALRLLAVRARSVKEIRAKLADKGVDGPVLEKVIEKLLDLNYLDDAEFAGQWTRHLAFNLLYGDRRIEASLREKGVPEEIIRRSISENREELDEKAALRRILNKKIKGLNAQNLDRKLKARLARMLAGRGFSTGLIYEALRNPQEDNE
ncbi:MAG: regulatory protein RecX [Syntrophaceae bacterium]